MQPLTRLGQIFQRHGTDKWTHGYDRTYEQLWSIGKRAGVKNVLEVGIGTCNPNAVSTVAGISGFSKDYQPGASLRAWAEFFPKATVWGIDPQPDTITASDGDRIIALQADSGDPACRDSLPYNLDVIVDDGDHAWETQIATLVNLWPHLKTGGYYVIEDITRVDTTAIVDVVGFRNWYKTIIVSSRSYLFLAMAIPKR